MTIGSRRRIDRAHLQAAIPEYRQAPSHEAFERMFERDKAEILALGIPLRTETVGWDDVVHYRIDRSDTETDLDLSVEEYTILLAASRAWDDALAGGAARRLRAKLLSLGHDADPDLLRRTPRGALESLPVLSPLLDAVTGGGTVAFQYRATTSGLHERVVEPWAVSVHEGHWYVYGYDRHRAEPRLFRASRIESFPRSKGRAKHPRPEEVRIGEVLSRRDASSEQVLAQVDVVPFKAQGLRRLAEASVDAPRLTLGPLPAATLRRAVLAEARWSRLLDPAAVRDEVCAVLRTIADAHHGPADLDQLQAAEIIETPRIRATTTGPEHLTRLVSIASYVLARGEADLDELAEAVGIQRSALIRDLELLFVCGDLGNGFEDLIEVVWEHDVIRVANADPLRRSLRLNASEITALLAGLAALEPATGTEHALVASARAKLLASADPQLAAVDHAGVVDGGPHNGGRPAQDDLLEAIGEALRSPGRTLTVRHSSPARAGTTVRRLRPIALETDGARSYLRAHCELAGEERLFRVDRLVELLEDDTPMGPSESADGIAVDPGRIEQDVWLRLEGPAHWIAEAFDAVERRAPDGVDQQILCARLERPVTAALVDAVLESGGAAQVLVPGEVRDMIETVARDCAERHRLL